jgi:PAS domain S-box-containing protein
VKPVERSFSAIGCAIVEHLRDPILLVDSHGRLIDANLAAERAFRFECSNALGKPLDEVLRGFSAHWAATDDTKFEADPARWVERTSGRTFECLATPLPAPDENQHFTLVQLHDVTQFLAGSTTGTAENPAIPPQLQAIIELARDSIFIWDGAGRITYWNSGAERLFGWTAAEAMGQEVHHLLATQLPAPQPDVMADFLRDGYWEGKLIRRRKDGAEVVVHSGWTLQRHANGASAATLEINNDIKERVRIEAELQESEERLRLALDAISEGLWDWNIQTGEVQRSDQWLRLLGYSREETIARVDFWNSIVHPDDLPEINAGLQAHFDGLTPAYQCECRLRMRSGEYRYFINRGRVVARDGDGRPLRMVGIDADITARKEIEQVLARYAAIVESSNDAIIGFDLNGTIQSWNRGAETLYQYAAQEAIGQPVTILIPSLRTQEFGEILERIRHDEPIADFETQRQAKDGRQIDVALTVSPTRNSTGELIGVSTIARDITERKAMMAALRANQVALEQARDAADAANRAKSLFLASMSHEIRTPMNAVTGLTSLLLDTELMQDQRDYVETIRSSADALLTIINDILDFSKIESNSMEFEVQPFNLPAAIEDALDLFAVKAAAKNIELVYHIASGVPCDVQGDITRLRQIVVNLVGNALKFTDQGEIVVAVDRASPSLRSADRADAKAIPSAEEVLLHFSVRDTGVGIPEDRRDRLFQSFSQVDASITRRYGGTGLGLAISKRLAELMGGSMWVESIVDRGSTFHFTALFKLPREQSVLPEPDPLAGARVLIVDDNETNRFILAEQTRRRGMRPTTVEGGAAALALLDTGATFDLVITDMLMPAMNGLEFYAAFRRHPSQPLTPAIMLTSLGENFLRDEARTLGITAFVAKPVHQAHLYEIMQNALQLHGELRTSAKRNGIFDRTYALRFPLRILLAEDNVVNQKVALGILDRLGYHADISANGIEVVDALARRPYDTILMDVQMPEMDGIEATRAIRRTFDADRQPVIIAMTASAMQEDRQACLDAGMDDFVSKPIRLEELTAALERASARVKPAL